MIYLYYTKITGQGPEIRRTLKMSLKEELSNNRREALINEKNLKELANEVMRRIINEQIYSILRLMNEQYPLDKKLVINIEQTEKLLIFSPTLRLKGNPTLELVISCKGLLPALDRVAREFDLDVDPPVEEFRRTVSMTLDD